MIRRINSLIVLFLVCGSVWAQNIVPVPPLKSRVTDQTNTLSETEKRNLESKLSSFEQSKGSQVAVLVIPTTGDETIEQYGIRVADQWKIGREGVDDGA
ncbi:MAG: TPM domain-containing protein, partial [Cyclobacteriaceae bacterium]